MKQNETNNLTQEMQSVYTDSKTDRFIKRNMIYLQNITLVEAAETETEVEAEDSELADSDSGDPGRLIFFRFRGRPFNFGAEIKRNLSNLVSISKTFNKIIIG